MSMDKITVQSDIGGETWTATVFFDRWVNGPQNSEAPAVVTRDDEAVPEVKWANSFGGAPPGWGLVDNGCLWAPGVIGQKPRTACALAKLTELVQREVWKTRGEGRAVPLSARAVA